MLKKKSRINLITTNILAEFALNLDGPLEKLPLSLSLNDLAPSETASIQFVMRAHKIGDRNLNINFNFMMEKEKSVASVKNDVLVVPVVKPFELTSSFLSTMFDDITKFYVGETFVAMPVINCSSPWTIVLEETKLEFVSVSKFFFFFGKLN